ncbi:hypothetical protein MES4922_320113 [Mesorhizobium ventifaucium]|uniref:Uncharacterized protein n=1 Tax=Mesorhizobium ventifaucium TaxID=666020 RepID=A0ABM9E4F2_9HYPH|nr:hypothetical protein MES4922_320113 [Mesorhizobium ventifaucium]
MGGGGEPVRASRSPETPGPAVISRLAFTGQKPSYDRTALARGIADTVVRQTGLRIAGGHTVEAARTIGIVGRHDHGRAI